MRASNVLDHLHQVDDVEFTVRERDAIQVLDQDHVEPRSAARGDDRRRNLGSRDMGASRPEIAQIRSGATAEVENPRARGNGNEVPRVDVSTQPMVPAAQALAPGTCRESEPHLIVGRVTRVVRQQLRHRRHRMLEQQPAAGTLPKGPLARQTLSPVAARAAIRDRAAFAYRAGRSHRLSAPSSRGGEKCGENVDRSGPSGENAPCRPGARFLTS